MKIDTVADFKLLAIRPIKGCNRRFLKNLTPGLIYPLYNSYSFYNDQKQIITNLNNTVDAISENVTIPNNLYNRTTSDGYDLKINISAIVGKNGSGKSTLIEFLFSTIYLFSVNKNILVPNRKSLIKHKNNLEAQTLNIRNRQVKLAKKKDNIIEAVSSKHEKNGQKEFNELKDRFVDFIKEEEDLKTHKSFLRNEKLETTKKINDIYKFGKELKAEIYFELNSAFFCLILNYDEKTERITSKIIPIKRYDNVLNKLIDADDIKIDQNNLSNYFFYTIAVNYSHYALNSMYLGDWITNLFHKNDGYTTPIVINPMRTEGNFKIASEMAFARYRLLTNVLKEEISSKKNKVYITENQFIDKVKLTLNKAKINKIPRSIRFKENELSGDLRAVNLLQTLLADYLTDIETISLYTIDFPLKEIVANYILQKVEKIVEIYPWFGSGYQFSENTPFIENARFFKSLKDDGSHITYKLKQAINFLKYNLNAGEESVFYVKKEQLKNNSKVQFEFSLDQLIKWMNHPTGSDIIRFLPPSVFDIDFELANDLGSKSYFNELSSGEQQLIHTIQSVIYHLNNLQSAHLGGSKRIKYKYINIIYDEIELYFHPDYQRRFISDLLKAFERLYMDTEDRIEALNILFLTHSPFILSDIPKENVMLLALDKKTKRSVPQKAASQTFAANINDLLSDGFFLKGTLIGSFAETEIRSLIGDIKNNGQVTQENRKLLEMVGDSFLKSSLQNLLNLSNDKNTNTRN